MINTIKATWINFLNQLKYNRNVNETIKELSKLSDKELNDIGVARGDIWYLAHTSYDRPKKMTAKDFRAVANENMEGWV